MWDIIGDEVDSLDDSEFFEVVDLSLDEPSLEADFLNVEWLWYDLYHFVLVDLSLFLVDWKY